EGFDPADFGLRTRYDPDVMLAELKALAETQIADEPLRRLVLTLLDRHAGPLKHLPATQRHFYPFPGGLLEHTLAVTQTCIDLVDNYAVRHADLQPPLTRHVGV